MTEVSQESKDTCLRIVSSILPQVDGEKFSLVICSLTYIVKTLCQQEEIADNPEVITWVLSALDDLKGEIMENLPAKEKEWLN